MPTVQESQKNTDDATQGEYSEDDRGASGFAQSYAENDDHRGSALARAVEDDSDDEENPHAARWLLHVYDLGVQQVHRCR